MAGPKINVNRYRLIVLLYVIFVCLSVLNIPVSLLDSNYHLIKMLEYEEKSRKEDVAFADTVIQKQDPSLFRDTAQMYLKIKDRIYSCFNVLDSVDTEIQRKFAESNSSIFQEFNSKRKMEKFLQDDGMLDAIKTSLFSLNSFLEDQPFQLDSSIATLAPVVEQVTTLNGKTIEWDRYLWLHKPVSISYMHIKRIKVLLLDNALLYQNEALKTINFKPAYYSAQLAQLYTNPLTQSAETSKEAAENKDSVQADEVVPSKKVVRSATPDETKSQDKNLQKETRVDPSPKKETFDDFFQKVINSFHAEHLYVGVMNEVLNNFSYSLGTDFALDVFPQADIINKGRDYFVTFKTTGPYTLRFSDKRSGESKLLFEKKVDVSLLPTPVVRLNGDNNLKDLITVKDLFIANRLTATVPIPDMKNFPGRINGYRVTKISKNKESASVYNYSEVFQAATQNLIKGLEKGDMILFDRITLSLLDGTTRSSNLIVYKIDE